MSNFGDQFDDKTFCYIFCWPLDKKSVFQVLKRWRHYSLTHSLVRRLKKRNSSASWHHFFQYTTWSYSEDPGYKGQPRYSSAITQPRDHISIASLNGRPRMTSGALERTNQQQTLKPWPNGLASRRKFAKPELAINLCRLALGGQTVKNLRPNLSSTKVNASQRKSSQVLASGWPNETQVERKSQTFGQGFRSRSAHLGWVNFVYRQTNKQNHREHWKEKSLTDLPRESFILYH